MLYLLKYPVNFVIINSYFSNDYMCEKYAGYLWLIISKLNLHHLGRHFLLIFFYIDVNITYF